MKPSLNPFTSLDAPRKAKARRAPPAPRAAPLPVDDIDLPAGARIICPYPPVACNPNHRRKWESIRARKAYRHDCWALALAAGVHAPESGAIRIHLDFFPPDARSRDDDNAEASFKAGRDGIAQALRAEDSRFIVSRTFHAEPRCCVVVTLLEGDAA